MRALTPAQLLLLSLARLDPDPADAARVGRLVRDEAVPWDDLLTLAVRLWVHPLLAHGIGSRPEVAAGLPDVVGEALGLSRLAARARLAAYGRVLAPVWEAWRADGIEVTLLKGAALAEALYPPGSRLLNDLDLWVRPDRLEDAARLLLDHGFVRVPLAGRSAEDNRRDYHGWVFRRAAGAGQAPLVVDLHDRLYTPGWTFQLDPGTAPAGPTVRVPGTDASATVLTREDAVVHLATQMAVDARVKVQSVADLAALLTPARSYAGSAGGIDVARLEERAVAARAEGAVALALRWARAYGAPVPKELVTRLGRRSPWTRSAAALLFDVRGVFPERALPAASTRLVRAQFVAGATRRSRAVAAAVAEIEDVQRREGVGPWARRWRAARMLPLMAGTWLVARSIHALRGPAPGLADHLGGRLWRARVDEPAAPSPDRLVEGEGAA